MIKILTSVLFLFIMIGCTAQKGSTTISQKEIKYKGKEIKLVKIINDSRCPEGSQCIWAGDVSFEVTAYNNGEIVENTQLTLNQKNQVEIISWFEKHLPSNKQIIKEVSVYPYPKEGVSIKAEEYFIKLKY
jgi:hypothetical protein